MTNTVIVADLLQSQLLAKLDKELVAKRFCNTQYEGQLKKSGTTVRVPIFPDTSWVTGATAGGTITISDFAVTDDTLTVAGVAQFGKHIQDFEEVRSNFNLQTQLVDRMAYSLADTYDQHIFTVAIAGAGNALTDAISGASDVYAGIVAMQVAMDEDNVPSGNRILFVNPTVAGYIQQANIWDGTESGVEVRVKGYIGMVAGFMVVKTNNLPTGKILAIKDQYVHFVEQMNRFKIVDQTDAMGVNLLGETLYQAKVFSELENGVCTQTLA